MRHASKPCAKPGLSTATLYRACIKSFATDLEAMVDAYGAEAVADFAHRISEQFREHGTSLINYSLNIEANNLPLPKIRKTKKADKRRSKFAKRAA